MRAGAKLGELLGRRFDLQKLRYFGCDLRGAFAVCARGGIQDLDVLADLAKVARAGLGAQRTLRHETRKHGRRREQRMPRVVRQRVVHGLDDVGECVESHHVGGAIGRALGASDGGPGQRIDDVERQLERLRVLHRRDDREDPDAIGDEVGRVAGADHPLAERRGQEGLERVDKAGIGVRPRDHLDEMHVPWRIEEVHAAKARAYRLREHGRQRGDGKSRRVGDEDRLAREMRRDLGVEVLLPIESLCDRLDHEVAFAKQRKIGIVVASLDGARAILRRQRRGIDACEVGDGLGHEAVGIALLRRQVEQAHRNLSVSEMRGNLRAHDARAEHRSLTNWKK